MICVLCDRFRRTRCWSRTFWAIVWRGSISTRETTHLYPASMTSQVRTGETVARANVQISVYSLWKWDNKEKSNCPNTWAVKLCLFHFLPWPHSLLFLSLLSTIPAMIAHHARVYLVQLPGTDCGRVGLLPARPSAKKPFPAKLCFFPLSMAEQGSRSCQVHWGSAGRRESRVSRRAVHVYYFRLLAALPRRLWGESLKRHTIRYFYSWRNKLVSV